MRSAERITPGVNSVPVTSPAASNSSSALRQKLRAIDAVARNDMRTADCSSFAAVWENMTKGGSRSINPVWPMGD